MPKDISKGRRKDIGATAGEVELSWDPGDIPGSIDGVFRFAVEDAKKAIEWYLKSKRGKKIGARVSRFAAILFAAIAGILPVLLGMIPPASRFSLPPATASVIAGLAAAMVALDRFFGFSSGWVRYIMAEVRIRKLLEEFQIDWVKEKSAWQDGTPTPDQTRAALERIKTFVNAINGITQEETTDWVTEFKANLQEIDELVKTKVDAVKTGGLSILVSNGDQCEDGWKLSIDGGSSRKCSGKTAAISKLTPEPHIIKVTGTISGQNKAAEAIASVQSGGIVEVELTLD